MLASVSLRVPDDRRLALRSYLSVTMSLRCPLEYRSCSPHISSLPVLYTYTVYRLGLLLVALRYGTFSKTVFTEIKFSACYETVGQTLRSVDWKTCWINLERSSSSRLLRTSDLPVVSRESIHWFEVEFERVCESAVFSGFYLGPIRRNIAVTSVIIWAGSVLMPATNRRFLGKKCITALIHFPV